MSTIAYPQHLENSNFSRFLIYIVLFLFPKKITKTYCILTLLAFIFNVKSKIFIKHNLDLVKLNYLLHITLNEDMLVLSGCTYHWMWKNDIMTEVVKTNNDDNKTVKEILNYDKISSDSLEKMVDIFVSKLPWFIKLKLGLRDPNYSNIFKKEVSRSLLYNF